MTEPSKTRRKLFKRSEPDHPLTGMKIKILVWLSECGILSLPQLSLLIDKTESATRRHMSDLYHGEYVDRIGADRSALAGIDTPNTPDLLGGRAPTLYRLSRKGATAIGVKLSPDLPDYGPKNSTHLAHTLEIRDVRVWLERLRRHYGHVGCTRWESETRAHIGRVEPDALFIYQFPKNPLVGLVETDRGTEKSPRWWEDKLSKYQGLFAGNDIMEATGLSTGRVIVIAPNAARRDKIASVLSQKMATVAKPTFRFWITERTALDLVDLTAAVWRVPEGGELRPLVPETVL